MPDRVSSNHEFLQSLRDWSGIYTMERQFGNEMKFRCSKRSAGWPSSGSATADMSLDLGLTWADAQVPVVTMRGGR
jgi:hypothetical protein